MADENKQLKDTIKKQDNEIVQLKRAVNVLQKQIKQLQINYTRVNDKVRVTNLDLHKVLDTIRRNG